MLYVLFVADLIAHLDETPLKDGQAELDGKHVRGLQLADDLALIAQSERDLNALLETWANYCDRNHQETQTKKTEVLVFTEAGDTELHFHENTLRQGERQPLNFKYRSTDLKVSEHFVYLGVLFDWLQGPEGAWGYRNEKGWKAMGGLCGSLRWVPFLPFARTVELAEAIIGGAYLYSSDLWAPYIDKRQKGVSGKYMSFLFGFGKARSERLVGWLPIRDLDTKGEAAVVRMLSDGAQNDGLLRRSLRQLYKNWVHMTGPARKELWIGRVLKMVRRVWPHFTILAPEPNRFTISGIPPEYSNMLPQRAYTTAITAKLWIARQNKLLRTPPTFHQQDYVLAEFIRYSCSDVDLNTLAQNTRALIAPKSGTIINVIPRADTDAVRVLLRTLGGMEDFARVNAHYTRREIFPNLRSDRFKHKCLFCLVYRHRIVIDTEWHAFCECPTVDAARKRFCETTKLTISDSNPCTVRDLHDLVAAVAADSRLVGALAQFSYDIRATRRHHFRTLSSNGHSGRIFVAAQLLLN